MAVNTKLVPTGDTMPGAPTHQNPITEDSFVLVNRQNQDTFAIPKNTSD